MADAKKNPRTPPTFGERPGAPRLSPKVGEMRASAESYGAFAWAYDQALGRRFFRAVQRMLVQSLEERPPAEMTHLDIACGTGYAMELFARRGFRSVGVDLSLPMLQIARTRVRRLVCADLRALPLRRTFARITC